MNFFKVIEYCESCDENGSCQYKKYPGKRESCAKHRHIKEKKELSSDEEFLNFMILNTLTLEQLESMYQKWRNFNYMTRKDIEHTLSEFEGSNKINAFRELKDPEPVMLNTYIPTQYPVYIKWTDGTELLIYFNELVYIKHDAINKIMSVVNVNTKCLFITHQNNVEYMHVGSQPPVYLAKHMNIPVDGSEEK